MRNKAPTAAAPLEDWLRWQEALHPQSIALGLERVVWVPAGRPPHKTGQIVSMDQDRLAMLDLALGDSAIDEITRSFDVQK